MNIRRDVPGLSALLTEWETLAAYYRDQGGIPEDALERLADRHNGTEVVIPCGPRHVAVVSAEDLSVFRRSGADPIFSIHAEEVSR